MKDQHWLQENIQAIAAIIILITGFCFLEWGNATETIKQGVKDLMFIVATFYFGGSRASGKKDDTIAAMSANQQPTITQTGSEPSITVTQPVGSE